MDLSVRTYFTSGGDSYMVHRSIEFPSRRIPRLFCGYISSAIIFTSFPIFNIEVLGYIVEPDCIYPQSVVAVHVNGGQGAYILRCPRSRAHSPPPANVPRLSKGSCRLR